MSVRSGRCVPPGKRVVDDPDLTRARIAAAITAATASGIAPRCTGIEADCATICSGAASQIAVLQSRRSVMFGREGAAHERRLHLLGHRAQGTGHHLEGYRVHAPTAPLRRTS